MEPCKPRESERNRRVLYQSIQDMLDVHYSHRQIAKALKVSRNTIAKIACGNIENLCQSSCPVKLMDFIETLEKALGKTAKKEYLPMQPGDVYQTYADVSELEREFGFRPMTTIDKGLEHFASWYREFYGMNC